MDPTKFEIEIRQDNFKNWLNIACLDLKAHQLKGHQWICEKEKEAFTSKETIRPGAAGGIIADEMGLGKTILCIGTIISMKLLRNLIVVPLSLLDQWRNAILTMCGHNPIVYHGTNRHLISFEKLNNAPIVLTTYGVLSIDVSEKDTEVKNNLQAIEWNRVFCDEAHHLRNKNTKANKRINNLKKKILWLVTGTPIQNSIQDIVNLIKLIGLKEESLENEIAFDINKLRNVVRQIVLFRSKDDAKIVLPPIREQNITVSWKNEDEFNVAKDIHSGFMFSNVTSSNVCSIVSALTDGYLPALMRARQICVYPPSLNKSLDKLKESGIIDALDVPKGFTGKSKLRKVISVIKKNKDNGKKKIVFCHFRAEIKYLVKKLRSADFDCEKIDGSTSLYERSQILSAGESDKTRVLVLQIQTGCEGLNLQQYSEIHFTSPHWNPAVEDQAVARAHRIGQTDTILVFRYLMAGFSRLSFDSLSIDQYCSLVQERKRQYDRDVFGKKIKHSKKNNEEIEYFKTTFERITKS